MTNLFKKNHDKLMHEELVATWYATSLLLCVLGAQFSAREGVLQQDRQTLDVLFLSIAIFIIIWSMCSFYNMISFFVHRLGLLLISLCSIASFLYLIYLASQNRI